MYFSKGAVEEVMYVATLMSNTYRCALPTGLHVHVGNSKDGFSSTTIQNLVATYFAFENTIELIHPASRKDNYMFASLRRGSEMMHEKIGRNRRTIEQGLEHILLPENEDITALWEATKSVPWKDDQVRNAGKFQLSLFDCFRSLSNVFRILRYEYHVSLQVIFPLSNCRHSNLTVAE